MLRTRGFSLLPYRVRLLALAAILSLVGGRPVVAQVAIFGDRVYPVDGTMIENGVVVIENGKITAVGAASSTVVPDGLQRMTAPVVTPGFVDAHSTVGFSGILNYNHDQDQLERSTPMQPELRAIDAYNCREQLVEWVRSFGVTTMHTGHAPGELISGQTMIVKTFGNTVEDAAVIESAALAVTLAGSARKGGGKSPGTRGKMMAMLRQQFIKAGEYQRKIEKAEEGKEPARDLKMEVLGRVLSGDLPIMITANRAQDIASALRLASEFDLQLMLDGAAESYLLIDRIKKAKIPVLIHPTMARAHGEMQNMSFETAAKLIHAGIPVAFQSGYESYVPKTRVLVFEAGIAAAHGLTFDEALHAITLAPAQIFGIDGRVGSLTVGKDGDVALFDGDPFEYTTHCLAVIGEGAVINTGPR
ncbi:MAG: amidohydrolase family protein [Planctomycetota bacterium]|jgi:imidazolonepropionase-like amidohydrolase